MASTSPDPLDDRLARRDPELFAHVPSATTPDDRRSLLRLQAAVRRDGDYAYLEIGSHLGGTLQPHVVDPRCGRIYSIDKRTPMVADIRGVDFAYRDNSSAAMLAGLRAAFGDGVDKIVAFDCDAREVPAGSLVPAPRLCFIDGEHTVAAVLSDFAFCRRIVPPDAIIAFHDGNLIFQALRACRRALRREGVEHRTVKLPGSVYAILLGGASVRHGPLLAAESVNERWFFLKSALLLPWERLWTRLLPIWGKLVWTLVGWRSRLRRWMRRES